MSKASIFKGKLVTSRCCLDDGLRRTGDWSEAGITLSCCCSVICSVSPDRHWLVLIMATRGAGGGLIREADTEHPDSQAGSGARHTPIPDTGRGCRVNLHLLEPKPAAHYSLPLSTTHSFSVLTNTAPEVAWWKLICMWIHVFV